MNKRKIKYYLAPFGVFTGIAVVVYLSNQLARVIDIAMISEIIALPRSLYVSLGIILVLSFFSLFVIGFRHLGRSAAVGQSDKLQTMGAYKYVRNPMYSGLSLTIIGIGFITDLLPVIFAGIIWYSITIIQCKREEKELAKRFGAKYIEYKRNTPMLLPNIKSIFRDFIVGAKE